MNRAAPARSRLCSFQKPSHRHAELAENPWKRQLLVRSHDARSLIGMEDVGRLRPLVDDAHHRYACCEEFGDLGVNVAPTVRLRTYLKNQFRLDVQVTS